MGRLMDNQIAVDNDVKDAVGILVRLIVGCRI